LPPIGAQTAACWSGGASNRASTPRPLKRGFAFWGAARFEIRFRNSVGTATLAPSPAAALPQASVAERPIALPPETGAHHADHPLDLHRLPLAAQGRGDTRRFNSSASAVAVNPDSSSKTPLRLSARCYGLGDVALLTLPAQLHARNLADARASLVRCEIMRRSFSAMQQKR
jgi:hypothetical protein